MSLRSIKELKNIRGKRILVRVDFNVPILSASGSEKEQNRASRATEGSRGISRVADDTKIASAVPTIEFLVKKGAKVILMTHFGRPEAKKQKSTKAKKQNDLSVVGERLSELLKNKVRMIEKWDFKEIEKAVGEMSAGEVLMLPNLRLHPGEEKNSLSFARDLLKLGQIYVNEAFSVSHRAHGSVVRVPKMLPSASYAGLQFIKEVEILGSVLLNPKRPFVVLMGGGKITDKMAMLSTMVNRADLILVGGALATHFFKAMGYEVGASRIEKEGVRLAKKLLRSKKIILPKDLVVGTMDGQKAWVEEVALKHKNIKALKQENICEKPYGIWDIGPQTILEYAKYIKTARLLIWNGPMGLYEVKRYSHGTAALGRLFAARSKGRAFGIAGGGETIDALRQTGIAEYVDFISTGGGAMIEYLSSMKLPGIEALKT